MRRLSGGSERPPDRAATGLPGARYIAAKMTKLATSKLPPSIARRRAKNRRRTDSALSAQLVRPGGEHVRERRHGPREVRAGHQDVHGLDVRDPGKVSRYDLLRLRHFVRPLLRIGRAARVVQELRHLRVVVA